MAASCSTLVASRTSTSTPPRETIKTGPGASLGDLDRAGEPHGLVVPTGIISVNTIGGLTLAGGYGWLIRAYGLTVDNLLEAEVVTAAGEVVHASESENADLFWGLKGGGGNFGVVTSFTFRAQPLRSPILAGNLIYSVPKWRDALRAYARLGGQPRRPDEHDRPVPGATARAPGG